MAYGGRACGARGGGRCSPPPHWHWCCQAGRGGRCATTLATTALVTRVTWRHRPDQAVQQCVPCNIIIVKLIICTASLQCGSSAVSPGYSEQAGWCRVQHNNTSPATAPAPAPAATSSHQPGHMSTCRTAGLYLPIYLSGQFYTIQDEVCGHKSVGKNG